MVDVEKSDIIKNVLQTLVSISGRKTDRTFALTTLDSLLKQLEPRFDFLKHIHIKETLYSEDQNMISVMSDFSSVAPDEFGKAIHALIFLVHQSLGDRAGHFFIKEIQNTLGDEQVSVMKEMGIDFHLMQLEDDVTRMELEFVKKKI